MGRFYGLYFRLGYFQLRLLLSVRLGLNLGETQAQDQAPSPSHPTQSSNHSISLFIYLFSSSFLSPFYILELPFCTHYRADIKDKFSFFQIALSQNSMSSSQKRKIIIIMREEIYNFQISIQEAY